MGTRQISSKQIVYDTTFNDGHTGISFVIYFNAFAVAEYNHKRICPYLCFDTETK